MSTLAWSLRLSFNTPHNDVKQCEQNFANIARKLKLFASSNWIFDKFSIFEARISLHIFDYQPYRVNLTNECFTKFETIVKSPLEHYSNFVFRTNVNNKFSDQGETQKKSDQGFSSSEIVTHELLLVRQGRLLQLKIVEQQKNYDHYVMKIYNFRNDDEISNLDIEVRINIRWGRRKIEKRNNK